MRLLGWLYPDGELVAKICTRDGCWARLPIDYEPTFAGRPIRTPDEANPPGFRYGDACRYWLEANERLVTDADRELMSV